MTSLIERQRRIAQPYIDALNDDTRILVEGWEMLRAIEEGDGQELLIIQSTLGLSRLNDGQEKLLKFCMDCCKSYYFQEACTAQENVETEYGLGF